MSSERQPPDAPSRHHLPFDRLMALSKAEGLRCLRSLLSFDLEALDRLAAYYSIRLSQIPLFGGESSLLAPPLETGFRRAQLAFLIP